jgi:Na+-transporting methylmalonyl-CoA/oxaloacetate decarboxylase gamma subunit
MVDWTLAAQIASGGFGMVFLILAIIAVAVWLTYRAVNRPGRTSPGKERK